MPDCQHGDFITITNIFRTSRAKGGPITGYTAEINIRCSECGQEFRWIGLDIGSSPYEPMTSFGGTVLRAPITPATPLTPGTPDAQEGTL